MKENIVRLANTRRVQIEDSLQINNETIPTFLMLIRDRLEYQISLARRMDLVDAVQEISMQTDNSASNNTTENCSWLSSEYADILKQQEQIR